MHEIGDEGRESEISRERVRKRKKVGAFKAEFMGMMRKRSEGRVRK